MYPKASHEATLASMLIVTQSLQPSGMGVQDLEQGHLIIALDCSMQYSNAVSDGLALTKGSEASS